MKKLINKIKLFWYGKPFDSSKWCHDHCAALPCKECEIDFKDMA